jgi:hypothetical protein
MSADVHERFTDGPWAGQVPGIDVVLSLRQPRVFQHHDVSEEMRGRHVTR